MILTVSLRLDKGGFILSVLEMRKWNIGLTLLSYEYILEREFSNEVAFPPRY